MHPDATAITSGIRERKQISLRVLALVFAYTSFLSAFLLFQVQLVVSKFILPWFGGAAAVWTTALLVFQVLLLCGYVYSHLVSTRLSPRSQSTLHLVILAVAFLLILVLSMRWPSAITPSSTWKPVSGSQTPVWDVTYVLLLAAGLPFFVLSTTGPLLQRWFALQGGDAATYRLYSVSNLGSLLGLITFPFLMEPAFRMTTQGRLWAVLFGAFLVGCAWCAWRLRQSSEEKPLPGLGSTEQARTPATVRTLWFLLTACASALLLATTNLLCQEITAIPLLWVLPLSLYLLSFILCFDHPGWYRRAIFHPLFVFGIFALCVAMQFALRTAQVVIMPPLLFVACMICHGELVRLKPDVQRLTSFYLAISAGGALGGVFVAVVAPHIFRFFTEFQLALGATVLLLLWCLFLDRDSWLRQIGFWLSLGLVVAFLLTAYSAQTWIPPLAAFLEQRQFFPAAILVSTLALTGAYVQQKTPAGRKSSFRAGQVLVMLLAALALAVLYRSTQPEPGLYLGRRNFYGALRIYELGQGGKALFHGQTMHGAQLNPPNDRLPMVYYGPQSGIGILLRNHPKRSVTPGNLRIGVVGLCAGTLAAYGAPGDYMRYYEINPDVIALSAGAQPVFTYIRDSQARVETELGDARLLLEREAAKGENQDYDVLVLDAFSGDAVPVHLLTTEAFDTYWKHLNPEHGIIAIHVSSRHINLLPVIQGIAQHYKADLLPRFMYDSYPFLDNLWVFLARHPDDLQVDGLLPNPPPLPNNVPPKRWTDDYSDIIHLLY